MKNAKEDGLLKQFQVMIRLILFLFGMAGCVGFIMPFLTRRILNIGNLSGLGICAVLMLYAV